MKNIHDKYIDILSTCPYNIVYRKYGLPDEVIINYIKKFRKKLKSEDLVRFLYKETNPLYSHNDMYIEDKVDLLEKIFGYDELKLNLSEEEILNISKSFHDVGLFIRFMNGICDQIFVGDDVDMCRSVIDLLECRSYKIYLLLNSEEEDVKI